MHDRLMSDLQFKIAESQKMQGTKEEEIEELLLKSETPISVRDDGQIEQLVAPMDGVETPLCLVEVSQTGHNRPHFRLYPDDHKR